MLRIANRILLAVGIAAAVIAAFEKLTAADESRPNIILCMADDQGWGDVGYNGHPVLKTPTLDEMAATCLRFDRFYAAAPVCSPTRGSVLTGRHPNRFGCFSWGHTLRPQEITIAEALQKAGYRTGHFGKWHLGPVTKESRVSPGNSGFDVWFSSPNFFENDPLMSHNGRVVETKGESSIVTVEAALEFIRKSSEQREPFLAVVWFGSPHTPHIAVPEDRAHYADQTEKMQNYYGEITGIDRAVGRLRAELRKMKIAENTLLWYTSDNGGMQGPLSTGHLRGRKGNLYEGGIRVPAIIEWPAKIKSPRKVSTPTGTVDIFPTLLELAGVTDNTAERRHPLDGISLADMIDGKVDRREKPLGFWVYPTRGRPVRSRQILAELMAAQREGRKSASTENESFSDLQQYSESERPGHAAWIDGDFKLHRIPGDSDKFRYSLFNLAEDPQEKTDLAEAQPERVRRMGDQLADWQRSVIRSLNGRDY